MKLDPGTPLLHYRLVEKIGQGGMGEVWRATDTTLSRDVAIKVLPESFAGDAERLGRFEREARLLASLNHPNIASIYGLHTAEGVRFLAMELVPGESLMTRIRRGAIPLDEAVPLALKIASGLEAAHEQGVIHRDLKPANIIVNHAGGAKILDFGLAKARDREPASREASLMATVTTPATQTGVILGTAAYMSPEQARGRPVDKRADIWAFGVVLWEMLTGRGLFGGETVSDTLAAILREQPDVSRLPAGTPAPVRELLRRCLAKDPATRLRDIGEARVMLSEPWPQEVRPGSVAGGRQRGVRPAVVAALVVIGLAAGAVAMRWLGPPAGSGDASRPSYHLSIPVPGDKPIGLRLSRPIAISPDGRRVVYASVAEATTRLYTRTMDGDAFEPVRGGENGIDPFFSPDGTSLGFLDRTNLTLRRIALGGVAPTTLQESGILPGSIWGPDGFIYYTPFQGGGNGKRSTFFRLPAAGGAPEPVAPETGKDGAVYLWPDLLPGGNTLICTVTQGLDFGTAEVRALDLKTRKEKVLLPSAQLARYVPTGHLLYLQGQTVFATRFDPAKVEIQGAPTAVLTDVLTNPDSGSAALAFSRNGTLIYLQGSAAPVKNILVGADREGHVRRLVEQSGDYLNLAASPVGQKIAVALQQRPGSQDVWVYDLHSGAVQKISEGGWNLFPVWSPDGKWIYFTSTAVPDKSTVMRAPADGSGGPEVVREMSSFIRTISVSPDGAWMMMDRLEDKNADLLLLPLEGEGDARPFLATPALEGNGHFSPDGRFVAYLTNQTGDTGIGIRSFPGPGPTWRITSPGVEALAWAPSGRELLYLSGTDVMAVPLGPGPGITPGVPHKLFSFEGAPLVSAGFGGPDLGVLPDGAIVSIRPAGGTEKTPSRIEVVLDWFDELEHEAP